MTVKAEARQEGDEEMMTAPKISKNQRPKRTGIKPKGKKKFSVMDTIKRHQARIEKIKQDIENID